MYGINYFLNMYSLQVIKHYAKHFKTRQPMPEDMLKKLYASKYLFAASEMQLQLFYSVLDQYYHTQAPQSLNTTDMLAKLQVEYYGLPYVKDTVRHVYFLDKFSFKFILSKYF